MSRALCVEDQKRLVTAFLRLNGMRPRENRDLFIELLERELEHPLPVTRDSRDFYDVWHLVDTCLAYPGGIATLVSITEAFYGGSAAVKQLNDLVHELLDEPPPNKDADTAQQDAVTAQRDKVVVARSAGLLATTAARLLSTPNQARYAEEFRAELWDLAEAGAGRWRQFTHAGRLLTKSLHLRMELKAPHQRKASP